MRSPVRITERIHAKIIVMMAFTAVPAITVFNFTVCGPAKDHGMVSPFPHKAATQPVTTHKHFMIIFQIPGAVPHGMAVFTKYERAFFIFLREEFLNIFNRRIHTGDHVQNIVRRIIQFVDALIVYRACTVQLFDQLGRFTEILTIPALISKRPEDNTRAVNVTRNQQFFTIQYSLFKLRIFRDQRDAAVSVLPSPLQTIMYIDTAMGLDISLIDNIEPQFITDRIELRSIRVM